MEEAPRIGVFVCGCGTHISKTVDVDEVRRYAEGLPDVVYATSEERLCSEETLSRVVDDVKRRNLNRIVVAACTPTLQEPRFMAITYGTGINPNMIEWVNIREQCAWVHVDNPREATEKAKDLIKMAVSKARFPRPVGVDIPQVDREKCIRCALCMSVCPFGAVRIGETEEHAVQIDELLCRRCGICAASCPAMAITLPTLPTEQIIAQVRAALVETP